MSHVDDLEDDGKLSGRVDYALWRRFIAFGKPHIRWFVCLFAVAFVTAAIEVALPIYVGHVIDAVKNQVENGNAEAPLALYAMGYAGLTLGFGVMIFSLIYICGKIVTGVSRDIRRTCFAHLQRLDLAYFQNKPVGWLMSRLTGDVGMLSRVMGWAILDLVWGAIMLVGISVAMLILDWRLALVLFVVVPLLVAASRYFQWRLLITSRKVRKDSSHLTAAFNEGLMGVRTTKSMSREAENLEEFGGQAHKMYDDSVVHGLYAAALWPVVSTICAVSIGLVLWYGGLKVLDGDTSGGGGFSLGKLVQFIGLATLFTHPIQELSHAITLVLGAQASAERVQQVLDTEPKIQDSEAVLKQMARVAQDAKEPLPLRGRWPEGPEEVAMAADGAQAASSSTNQSVPRSPTNTQITPSVAKRDSSPERGAGFAPDGHDAVIESITCRDLCFAYSQDSLVLKNINFTGHAGQTIALVGETGGGKSTLASLLCRFYDPTSGQVLINGVDLRDRSLDWLQSQMGTVPQAPQLFTGTVRENIRYGRLEATDEEVEAAAKTVHAHTFIEELPGGYEAKVGQGGCQLSTGQKQLIALARLVLADPQVFVMDEATSSVDTQTEQWIQSAIDAALENRLAFVIAHRLSTIRHADQILVIDAGQIVEQGNHETLVALDGRYASLYRQQYITETEQNVLRNVETI